MAPLEHLPVRFHFGGRFCVGSGKLEYVEGRTAISYIELDKVSLPEIKGHLSDHMDLTNVLNLHWLHTGRDLSNGLMHLLDDRYCMIMVDHISEGAIADIYVEEDASNGKEESVSEVNMAAIANQTDEIHVVPSKPESSNNAAAVHTSDGDDESSDEDYQQPEEQNSSADDEEAAQLRQFANEIKMKRRAKKLGENVMPSLKNDADALVPEDVKLQDDGSPYFSSSNDYSYEDDSEGNTTRWKSVQNRFDSNAPIPIFSLGMAFISSKHFKKALVKYGLATHRHLLFPKDEKDKVKSICSWSGCKWQIYGSKTSRSEWFQVVTFVDEHNCVPRRDNKLLTSRIIAKKYYDVIRDNPSWKVQLMQKTILKDFQVDVSTSQCKRAKSLVIQKALDSTKGEYSRVYDYQLELLRSNPGSTVVVVLNPDIRLKHVFQRFSVCFDACKKGFLAGCRKVVGLDGCFFKGATNGELMCAIGRDANNQMYPIAWAYVEKETYDSWYWFIGLLQKDLNISEGGEGWVIISDQQKELLKSVAELIPRDEHRMCARHIYANWRKKYTDKKLQKKFWKCAKSSCRVLYNYNKAKLAQDTPDGAKDMENTAPEHWSRAFFKLGSNCDSVDNNMCESFNNSIMDSRFLPVISMSESIRCKVMVRIQENRAKVEKWQGTICPNIFKKLKLNIERSSKCYVLWNGQDGFEVQEDDKRKYTVNLDTKTCSCRYWQLSGLPCCHAISAIYKASKQIDDYIAPCYEITEYIKTYQHCLQPVEGQESWPVSDMPRPLPPAYVKMLGRPKTQRTREQGEKAKGTKSSRRGIKMTCSSCHSTTHNTRTCPSKRDAGNTQNSYIRRDATRKRREREASTSDPMAATSTQQSSSSQTNNATKMAPRRNNSRGNTSRLAHLMFGNNY